MGLDITYVSGKEIFSLRLSPSDIELMDYLRKHGFEEEIEVVFGVSGYGENTAVKRCILSDVLDRFLHYIKTNRNVLPYTYILREEIPRGSGLYSTGGGIIAGFKIKGILHSIEGGFNKCVLTTLRQNKFGKWHDCDPQDIRDKKMIKTDPNNFGGDIEIKRRRKPTKLIKNLERLRSFLSETDETEIEKILG